MKAKVKLKTKLCSQIKGETLPPDTYIMHILNIQNTDTNISLRNSKTIITVMQFKTVGEREC